MRSLLASFFASFGKGANQKIENNTQSDSEQGTRPNAENATARIYGQMFVDTRLRQTIEQIRAMDREDTRVKKIHRRMARDATKGGVALIWNATENKRVSRLWSEYKTAIKLTNRNKLLSDARGLVMEGNLALQWVIDDLHNVVGAVRMPSETLVPLVSQNGRFKDVSHAYKQVDPLTMQSLCTFPLWQLSVTRLDPDNYDDLGSLGRPYLDAGRSVWKKLCMTEQDLVVRRRTRAPQKLAHSLEGATEPELEKYRAETEAKQGQITTDFYGNKLSVAAIGGDASLDQIGDVSYLLDTFFAGAPAPKGLFGYTDELARDVLEDLKSDYFEEIDLIQDMLAQAYRQGFELQLLLNGLNPKSFDFKIEMAERQTESRNQKADLGLKYQAAGMPAQIVSEVMGVDHQRVKALKEKEAKEKDPYPDDDRDEPPSKISITPGNARKGESATNIGHR